jgi:hypothetical protein
VTRSSQYSKALWRSWLARRPVTAEVAGSSPVRVAVEAHDAFRPGSSVGMSVRLKSGRSTVRSRPWPLQRLFRPWFSTSLDVYSSDMPIARSSTAATSVCTWPRVDVLSHRWPRVAELVGPYPRRQPGVVDQRGHRLTERVRRHIWQPQGLTDLAPLLAEIVGVAQRARRRREDHPGRGRSRLLALAPM